MPMIPNMMNDVAAQNLRNAQEWGLRPGDPTWISSKAQADQFHADMDVQNAKNQARDAAANGGLGEAWISNPGGDPRNYSNYQAPAPTAATPFNAANPTAWQSQLTNPQRRTTAPGYPAAPAAGGAGAGLSFANGTNLAPGQPIPPPGAGGANYALDVNKYLDPSMAFTMGEGMRALGSSASAGGQVNSGQTLRDIIKYSQGVAGQNWGQAANLAQQQQGFGRNIDVNNRDFTQAQNVNDRDFAYNAMRDDQTIPFNQQLQQAQLGLTASGQQSNLASVLATLLSNNTIAGGQAAGAGTIGGNNAVTSAISQILAQLTGNNLMNRIGV